MKAAMPEAISAHNRSFCQCTLDNLPPFPLGLCSAAVADDVGNVSGSLERAKHLSGGSSQDPKP